jgi:hypothetical protein
MRRFKEYDIESQMSLRKYHSSMMSSLYHLGRMRNYRGGGYSDSTTIGKYKVQFDEDEYDLRVLIWNPDRPCLNIVLSKDDTIAVLDSIE